MNDNYNKFLELVANMRKGQHKELYPKVYTKYDCFYDNTKIVECLDYIHLKLRSMEDD